LTTIRQPKSKSKTKPPHPPLVQLTEYQQAWVQDPSRFKIGIMCRQGGKSFVAALEAVIDAVHHRTDWVFLSAGERQTREVISKAKLHLDAIQAANAAYHLDSTELSDPVSGAKFNQLEITLRNGSRIIGLPANPATARGHSANLVLDEFGFHQHDREIWKAIFPTITRGFKIRIISTPNGRNSKLYDLWTNAGNFSRHFTDINQAVSQGLVIFDSEGHPTNPETLRASLDDDLAWQQEYLCLFIDESHAFIPMDLILQAETSDLKVSNPEAEPPPKTLIGIDIGRKRDLTTIWEFDFQESTQTIVHHNLTVLQSERFATQNRILHQRIDFTKPASVFIDSTGIGMQFSEQLQEHYGDLIHPIRFSKNSKLEMANTLRTLFEDGKIAIPQDRKIRADLFAVRRSANRAGSVTFFAEHTDDGHSDRFWALALVALAAKHYEPPFHDIITRRVRDFGDCFDKNQYPNFQPSNPGFIGAYH